MAVSGFPFLMTLTALSSGQLVCRMVLNWDLSGVCEDNQRGKISLSSHHIRGSCYEHDCRFDLDQLADSDSQVSALQGDSPVFHLGPFGRKSVCVAHAYRVEYLTSTVST